jgi:hypothetical protein
MLNEVSAAGSNILASIETDMCKSMKNAIKEKGKSMTQMRHKAVLECSFFVIPITNNGVIDKVAQVFEIFSVNTQSLKASKYLLFPMLHCIQRSSHKRKLQEMPASATRK